MIMMTEPKRQRAVATPPGGVLLAPSYVLNLPSAGSYASIPAISAYDVGTGDFTIEAWFCTAQGGPVVSFVTASSTLLTLQINPNGDIAVVENAAQVLHTGQGSSAVDGNWHQVALVRQNGSLAVYLDGVQQAAGPETTPLSLTALSSMLFGAAGTAAGAATFAGKFADIRLWNVARTQAQILQAMCYRLPSNTTATGYWTFTAQSLADSSSNHNSAGTLAGAAAYAFIPINYRPQSGTLTLTGAVPSVAISGNAAYNVGSGDFTIEAWVNTASSGTLISRTAGAAGITISCSAAGLLVATTSDGSHTTTVTQTLTDIALLGNWHHIAVSRRSATITLYVDGVPVGSATETTPVNVNVAAATPLLLGHPAATVPAPHLQLAVQNAAAPPPAATQEFALQIGELQFWQQALSQDQIYRGMLVELHGNESGLAGYWNFCTGNVVDLSSTRNLAVASNQATIAPSVLPTALPQYILSLPGGTGSYMLVPSQPAFDFGTGDFTVEMRFKASAAGTLLSRPVDPTHPSCGMQIRATAQALQLIIGDGSQTATYAGTVSLLDNQWHHVAWSRASGAMTLFVDFLPVACTPAQSTQNIATTSPLVIGALYDPAGQTASDAIVGSVDFVYLWNTVRPLDSLQQTSFQLLGGQVLQSIGAWTFDQQAPIDQSPTNANGMLGSSASIVADNSLPVTVPDSILHLTGSASAIDCSARTDLSFAGVQPYTVGAWVMPMTASATGTIVSRFDVSGATGAAEYRLRLVNGVPVAQRNASNGTVTGVTQLQAGQWYYLSMSYDGAHLAVQVNGITENTAAVGAVTAATNTHVYVAASATGSTTSDNLTCCVRNVAFWTAALTTAQLQTAMGSRLTGAEANLRALYDFLYAMPQDWTGNGPAATIANGRYQSTTLAVEQLRGALALDGNGSYLNCGGGRSLNVKGSITVEAWIRVTKFSTAWQPIVSKGSVYQLRRYNETNQITFSTANLSNQELTSTSSVNLLDGCWHHVAAVYDGQNKSLYIDGQLNATAAATGDISVGNGVLYVANNDGEILVVDQETGNEIWTARVFKPVQTSPVIDKNVMCVSSPSGDIFAFDYAKRTRLWDTQIPQGYQVPLKIDRDVVYFSGAGSAISAVDLLTGKMLWSMNGIANQAVPAIQNRTAYYCAQNTVFSRDLVSGRVKWAYSLQDATIGAPALLNNTAFVNCQDNNVYALNLGTVTTGGGSFTASAALIGSPVVENGTVFVATTDGTITALSYNATTASFTTVWSAKIAAGLTQALSVDSPYVGAIGNDNNLYAYNAVTGQLVWQYTKGTGTPSALSGLTVVNGAAYVSAADGTYNALDLTAKTVLWSKDLQTTAVAPAALSYAPLCIGASVDQQGTPGQGTFQGLISEVRLWSQARSAADIATTWHRRLVGDEPNLAGYWACGGVRQTQELDLSKHINPGEYVGNVASSLVDLQLADPLPRILAQSQMMQNWTLNDVSQSNKDGQVAFRTEITLLDGNGNPLVGSGIRVWTDAPATIQSAGVSYAVDNQSAASLVTDARGMISIVSPCQELTAATLQIWTEFMTSGERVIIHPDDNLRGTLASIQGSDLINPAQSTNPLIKGKPALLPNVTQAQANGLASAINNAVQNVARPATQPSNFGYVLSRGLNAAGAVGAGDVVSKQIQLAGSGQYAQYVAPGSIPNWQFNFQTYQFAPLSTHEVARMRELRATQTVLRTGEEGFLDLWDDFVNGVQQAANVIIETVGNAVKIVVQWVNTGIQTLEHIFQNVAEVGQAIFGVFKQLLSDIVDAAKKIYEYFAFLFDWDDILRTKNAIVATVRQTATQISGYIDTFIGQEQKFFAGLEQQVDDAFEGLIGRIGKQNLGQVRDMAPAMNPMLPGSQLVSATNPYAMRMQATAQNQATFGTEGNWLFSTALDNSGGITGGGTANYDASAFSFVDQAFEQIMNWASGSKALAAFGQAYDYFKQILTNPESFAQLMVQGVLEAFKGLAELALEIAQAVLTLMLQAVKALIGMVVEILSTPIDIPIVSWLYEQISGGSKLSMLDFVALLTAIPTTIVYKALSGAAPFQPTETRFAVENATALTGWQKALKTTSAVAQLVNLPLTIIMDMQPVTGAAMGTRMTRLTTAINVKKIGERLGPNLFRWTSVGLQLLSYATSAPWYFNPNPGMLDVANWFVAVAEFVFVSCVIAIYASVTREVWPGPGAVYASVAVGAIRLAVNAAIGFAAILSGSTSSASTWVSAVFSPIPALCKFLRTLDIVTQSKGLSLVALAVIDFVCGVIPPSVSLGLTWA